ncbi:MAG TPA: formyltransferase family protein [Candidatus Kryptonia bacterium]|nr:formyltransferase family protein [Candidatus Kryptonia bacterium]
MNVPFRVGFCVSGEGRLFRSAVHLRQRIGIAPVLLAAGHRASPQLESFCEQQNVPYARVPARPRETFERDITRICVSANLDLLCLTFDRILPAGLVKHYHGRIINTHLSLLPAFKGLQPLTDAQTAGTRFVGATIHQVEEEVDAGPIVAQCMIGVQRADTAESLGRRLFALVRPMYLQVIAWYAAGRVERDSHGRVWIRDAVYGELPVSPKIELQFPD